MEPSPLTRSGSMVMDGSFVMLGSSISGEDTTNTFKLYLTGTLYALMG
jgi:hypothetical protein